MAAVKSILGWLIGVFLIVVTFPFAFIAWLVTLPFDRNRSVLHLILNYHSLVISYLIPFWTLTIEGRDKVDGKGPYIIISNHQSILDILMINCLRYRYKWVSKESNLKVPFLGWYLRMADYIIIRRGDPDSRRKLYEKASKFLQRGVSVMMFPEGTRSTDCMVHNFKRGAFKLAIENNIPILPVVIYGTGDILPKNGFIMKSGHKIDVKVLDLVPPEKFETTDHDELADKFYQMINREFEELKRRECR